MVGYDHPSGSDRGVALGFDSPERTRWRRDECATVTRVAMCNAGTHDDVRQPRQRGAHVRRARVHSPGARLILWHIAIRGGRLSAQDLARGPGKGQPKLPPAAKSLVGRCLMHLDASRNIPRHFFTDAGMTALRQMMTERRPADPVKFAHVRRELGIGPDSP